MATKILEAKKILEQYAPAGEFLAYINKEESEILKSFMKFCVERPFQLTNNRREIRITPPRSVKAMGEVSLKSAIDAESPESLRNFPSYVGVKIIKAEALYDISSWGVKLKIGEITLLPHSRKCCLSFLTKDN